MTLYEVPGMPLVCLAGLFMLLLCVPDTDELLTQSMLTRLHEDDATASPRWRPRHDLLICSLVGKINWVSPGG